LAINSASAFVAVLGFSQVLFYTIHQYVTLWWFVFSHNTCKFKCVYFLAPPPALANVTVRPSTVLALLLWDVTDTGGYPITYFTAQYRQKHSNSDKELDHWHPVMPEHISPNVVSENSAV
jgi:hypothetical protein